MSANLREVIKNASFVSFLAPEERLISDFPELSLVVKSIRAVGLRIVLTMGTWDMFHIGHGRYLAKARQEGDILIVGVDDDEKTRSRKGPNRPVVPQDERFEMLTHSRYVDLAMFKKQEMEQWQMIKETRPDVLVVVEGTYTDEQLAEIQPYCGHVAVFPRQAETSTSAKLRRLILGGADEFLRRLKPKLDKALTDLREAMTEVYQSLENGKEGS